MRKSLLLISFFISLLSNAENQSGPIVVSSVLKGGINSANLSFDDDYEYTSTDQLGFHISASLDFKLFNHISLEPAVLFSTKGGEINWNMMDSDHEEYVKSTCLDFPLLLNVKFGSPSKFQFYINTGAYIGVNFEKSESISISTLVTYPPDPVSSPTVTKSKDHGAEFGLMYGAGIVAKNFVLSVTYDRGFPYSGTIGYYDYRNNVLMFSVGYRFKQNAYMLEY